MQHVAAHLWIEVCSVCSTIDFYVCMLLYCWLSRPRSMALYQLHALLVPCFLVPIGRPLPNHSATRIHPRHDGSTTRSSRTSTAHSLELWLNVWTSAMYSQLVGLGTLRLFSFNQHLSGSPMPADSLVQLQPTLLKQPSSLDMYQGKGHMSQERGSTLLCPTHLQLHAGEYAWHTAFGRSLSWN